MFWKRLLFLYVAVSFSCFCGSNRCRADDPKPVRTTTVIPFTLGADGRIYVQGLINNSVKATFLIDTGNDVNYLSTAVQDKLKLPLHAVTVDGKPGSRPSIIDGKVSLGVAPATVVLGGLNLTDPPFLLLPPAKLSEGPVPPGHVDGVIGSRTLENFAVLLDFSAKSMRIWYPSGLTKPEIAALNMYILYTVPITPSSDNPDIWVVHMQFSSETATAEHDMMIDTGAGMTTIPSEIADRLKLVSNQGGTATMFLNKKVFVSSAQVTKMQAGDFVLFSHPVFYPEKAVPGYPISLGMDVFHGYVPLIDFGQKTMYLGSLGMGVNTKPKQ